MLRATSVFPPVVALALVVAGCGSSSKPATSTHATNSPPPAATAASVTIHNFKYAPPTVTVKAGAKVTWRNTDSSPHTATASSGGFDTGTLNQGQSRTLTLAKAGRYAYICSFHPFMHGTVIVTAR